MKITFEILKTKERKRFEAINNLLSFFLFIILKNMETTGFLTPAKTLNLIYLFKKTNKRLFLTLKRSKDMA